MAQSVGGNAVWVQGWPLTSNPCQGYEWVQLYLHACV